MDIDTRAIFGHAIMRHNYIKLSIFYSTPITQYIKNRQLRYLMRDPTELPGEDCRR